MERHDPMLKTRIPKPRPVPTHPRHTLHFRPGLNRLAALGLAVALVVGSGIGGYALATHLNDTDLSRASAAAQAPAYDASIATDEALSLRIEKVEKEKLAESQAEEISTLQNEISSGQQSILEALTSA